jgi:hypothetical protein
MPGCSSAVSRGNAWRKGPHPMRFRIYSLEAQLGSGRPGAGAVRPVHDTGGRSGGVGYTRLVIPQENVLSPTARLSWATRGRRCGPPLLLGFQGGDEGDGWAISPLSAGLPRYVDLPAMLGAA